MEFLVNIAHSSPFDSSRRAPLKNGIICPKRLIEVFVLNFLKKLTIFQIFQKHTKLSKTTISTTVSLGSPKVDCFDFVNVDKDGDAPGAT